MVKKVYVDGQKDVKAAPGVSAPGLTKPNVQPGPCHLRNLIHERLQIRHHDIGRTTLDTYGHMWPDRDESTRAAVDAVLQDRVDYG